MRDPVLIPGTALMPVRWKNGGGVTREIAAGPVSGALDDFVWRLSIADVEGSGPFSIFEGIDRTLVLLTGDGMRLHEAGGATHALSKPLDIATFAGEAAIHATLSGGPTRDFNVMVRRGHAAASVVAHRGPAQWVLASSLAFVHCVSGGIDASVRGRALALAAGDTLRIDGPQGVCKVEGAGAAWLRIDIVLGRVPS